MKKFFNCILFILIISVANKAAAQTMQAEAKLQAYTIKIGEQTKLFLSIHQPASEKVAFPKLLDTLNAKVLVVGKGKPDTTFDTNDKSRLTVTQSYLITSFDAGSYVIHPFAFTTRGGPLTTGELTMQVNTVKVDTTKAIYDIKQPLAVSYTWWDWLKDHWLLVLIALVILAGAVAFTWYWKNRPKAEPVIKEVKPIIPLHIIALNKLTALRDKKLWQNNAFKEYHSELTDILREYLEKRYHIKTYEKTTDEIFEELNTVDLTNENKNMLRQILQLADLVKFAKVLPVPAENEHSMNNAVNFVTNTQQIIVVPTTIKQEEEAGK